MKGACAVASLTSLTHGKEEHQEPRSLLVLALTALRAVDHWRARPAAQRPDPVVPVRASVLAVAQRKPISASRFSNLVVCAGGELHGVMLQLPLPRLRDLCVIAFRVCQVLGVGGRRQRMPGLLEIVVPGKFVSGKGVDLLPLPSAPIYGPERAVRHLAMSVAAAIHPRPARLLRPAPPFSQSRQQPQRILQGHVGHRRRLDGLGPRRIRMPCAQREVGRLHAAAHNAPREAVRDSPLGQPRPDIARPLLSDLLDHGALGLHPLPELRRGHEARDSKSTRVSTLINQEAARRF